MSKTYLSSKLLEVEMRIMEQRKNFNRSKSDIIRDCIDSLSQKL